MIPRLVASLSVSDDIVDAGDLLTVEFAAQLELPTSTESGTTHVTLNLDHLNNTAVKHSLNCSHQFNSTLRDDKLYASFIVSSIDINKTADIFHVDVTCRFISVVDNDVYPYETVAYTLAVEYDSDVTFYSDGSRMSLNSTDIDNVTVPRVGLHVEANSRHQSWPLRYLPFKSYSVVAVGEHFEFVVRLVVPESTTRLSVNISFSTCVELSVQCRRLAASNNSVLDLVTYGVSIGNRLELLDEKKWTLNRDKFDEINVAFGNVENHYDNMENDGDNVYVTLRVEFPSMRPDDSLRLGVSTTFGMDGNVMHLRRALDVLVARPRLNLTLKRESTVGESGDLLRYRLSVVHANSSSLEARRLVIVMAAFPSYVDVRNGSSYVSYSSNVSSLVALDDYGAVSKPIRMEVHNVSEIVISLVYVLNLRLRPNTSVTIEAALEYGDRG